MSNTTIAPRTKFHVSLNVGDLTAAVEFYRVLFGIEPAKRYEDYAKFEVEEPPVVLSLSPHAVSCSGVLSNIGIQVADGDALTVIEQRLSAAAIPSRMQTDALCGYARQVKLWVADPDGNYWELYVPGEDVDRSIVERSVEGAAARIDIQPTAVWQHHLSDGPVERIPGEDHRLDEVRLQGTFNNSWAPQQQVALVREAMRVLRPGGKIVLHGLVANGKVAGQPSLPGLAALVSQVPLEKHPIEALREVGFVAITVTKFSTSPIFIHHGVEMREQRLVAWSPVASQERTCEVLYKGPFAEAVDDVGQVFPRGRRVKVSQSDWNRLRESLAAEQFLFLQPHGSTLDSSSNASCGCG
jgi:catechol 2,3-dioxygenase-like lactoylglutathione lyase family enzyme